MTHDEARELIGGDPETASAELLAHSSTCAQCQAYREEMLALNAKVRRALELDWQKLQQSALAGVLPAGLQPNAVNPPATGRPASAAATTTQQSAALPAEHATVTVLPRKAPAPLAKQKRPRLAAFAASLAAALLVGFTLWLSQPAGSLAAEIVTHVEGEPNSWQKVNPVPPDRLEAVLRKSGVRLGTGMDPVVYASSCWFRGHFVPHFVIMTRQGPVTVMILLHERVNATQQFNEAGYSGLLVPARTGSVAVLSRTSMALDQSAETVVHALQSAAAR